MCFIHINFRCRLHKWTCMTAVTSYLYKDKNVTLTSFTRKCIGLIKHDPHDVTFIIFFFFSIFLRFHCGEVTCNLVLLPWHCMQQLDCAFYWSEHKIRTEQLKNKVYEMNSLPTENKNNSPTAFSCITSKPVYLLILS